MYLTTQLFKIHKTKVMRRNSESTFTGGIVARHSVTEPPRRQTSASLYKLSTTIQVSANGLQRTLGKMLSLPEHREYFTFLKCILGHKASFMWT